MPRRLLDKLKESKCEYVSLSRLSPPAYTRQQSIPSLDRTGPISRSPGTPLQVLKLPTWRLERGGWPPSTTSDSIPPQACGRFQSTSSTTKAEHVSKYRYDPKMPRNIRESREIAQEVVLPGKDLQFVVRPPVAVRFGNFYWQRRIGLPSRVSCLLWR